MTAVEDPTLNETLPMIFNGAESADWKPLASGCPSGM